MKKYHVYIITNEYNTVLYTGVTSDIAKRIYQHKTGNYPNSFTKRYLVNKLVYTEEYASIKDAIKREKQIKSGSRKKKMELTRKNNPDFKEIKVM